MTYRKKLIEVALPLEAINRASAREKSIRHGHPSTLHLWWARRPLAACRAVLFASIVDDPDQEGVPPALLERIDRLPLPARRGPEWHTLTLGEQRRQKLLAFIERLVPWENSNDEEILRTARELIHAATDGNPPPVLDPFCGGGSIPLEAQRLGLEAHASDLNPVAVLITKALIEIPPKFAGRPPVNPVDRQRGVGAAWKGAAGLAADVRYYGRWMRDEAEQRIGHLYPKVRLPKEYGGGEATVIAWLWARTVKCPNPACGAQMPLVRSFSLSTKPGRKAWVEPVVDQAARTVRFEVRTGDGLPRDGTVNRRGATCIVCSTPVSFDHIRAEGQAGRLGAQLMAIVAEGQRGRVYVSPSEEHESAAKRVTPRWAPDTRLPAQALGFRVQLYGMTHHRDLFTARQLVALAAFSDLVGEARALVKTKGVFGDYADALAVYFAFAVSRGADKWATLSLWNAVGEKVEHVFGRNALSMTWDFAEGNPFSESTGNWSSAIEWIAEVLEMLPVQTSGSARQLDAATIADGTVTAVISTDPPYYDNVPYADLSDFFYVWLRRSLGSIHTDLFATVLTPKTPELIADPSRHGGRGEARRFFEQGLGKSFVRMREVQHLDYPLTMYYAFKQAEADESGDGESDNHQVVIASTGWETMLEGLLKAGFVITGTWPMRTERTGRLREASSNALASSIVLACRPRPANAPLATRREFVAALKEELPDALRKLQQGNIAPVDLAQAAIGPGMAVFSRYARVLEPDGRPMSVRTALALINQALDEVLAEQEGEFDPETRWAVAWFEQHGVNEGPFGVAETLSKAKNTAVNAMEEAGIVVARAGKVRLLRRDELPADWDPLTDRRVTVWEITQHLVRALDRAGEQGAGRLLAKIGALGETARDLAYRLYTIAERRRWAQEAFAYNALVVAWPEIKRLAAEHAGGPAQAGLI